MTWGHADSGGDSSTLRGQLKGVQQVQAARYGAFAALLEDECVVTWGGQHDGGDSSAVQDQLKGVQQIQSTYSSKWIESAAHPGPLLRFWKMDPSLLGALRAGAVTVRRGQLGLCCDSGRWIRRDLGSCRLWR